MLTNTCYEGILPQLMTIHLISPIQLIRKQILHKRTLWRPQLRQTLWQKTTIRLLTNLQPQRIEVIVFVVPNLYLPDGHRIKHHRQIPRPATFLHILMRQSLGTELHQ